MYPAGVPGNLLSPADGFGGRDHEQLQAIRQWAKGFDVVAAWQISTEVEEVDNKER